MKRFSIIYYVGNNPIPWRAIVSLELLKEMLADPLYLVAACREGAV